MFVEEYISQVFGQGAKASFEFFLAQEISGAVSGFLPFRSTLLLHFLLFRSLLRDGLQLGEIYAPKPEFQ